MKYKEPLYSTHQTINRKKPPNITLANASSPKDADANIKVVTTDKEEEQSLLKYKMTLFALLIPLSLQLVFLYKMNQFSVIKIQV